MSIRSTEECEDALREITYKEAIIYKWPRKKTTDKKPLEIDLLKPLFTPTRQQQEKIKQTILDSMNNNDIDMIEEYVPIIFDKLPHKHDLIDTLYMLAVLIMSYRFAKAELEMLEESSFKPFDKAIKEAKIRKGSREEDIRSLRTNVEQILKIIGPAGKCKKDSLELINLLLALYQNPDRYLVESQRYTISKDPIRSFFKKCEIEGRSKLIKEFIAKI